MYIKKCYLYLVQSCTSFRKPKLGYFYAEQIRVFFFFFFEKKHVAGLTGKNFSIVCHYLF